jgi:2-amino-4-hydroxy-6-hydroxymethyldihydropteridine diphosphokinase
LSRVAIALGSNVGDREAHLAFAVVRLRQLLNNLHVSTWRETAPVGVEPQPDFLNGALVGETSLTPRELLDELLSLERARGRVRPYEGAPRPLDLDLILFAQIAPDWVDPETGLTVGALLHGVGRQQNEERRTKD